MPILLSFDPGEATGIAWGHYDEETAYTRDSAWIIPGGARGLDQWIKGNVSHGDHVVVVSERFIPDGTAGGRETVSPQGEGVLMAHFDTIHWQLRNDKTWGMSSIDPVDAKLKQLGLWVTGKEVNWTDGRDANDATIHAIAYLRKKRHLPTLRWLR